VGGKGNAVLLVAATMFVGYLYLTGRLQRVIQVLAEPAPGKALETSEPGAIAPQGRGGLGIPRAPWQGVRVPTAGTPPIAPSGTWTPGWWWGSENQRRQGTPNPVPPDAGYGR
jgi:hypothetical protein